MMQFFLLLAIAALALFAQNEAQTVVGIEDYKDLITGYQMKIQSAAQDQKADLLIKLAIAYWHDQDQEKAIKTFLQALEASATKSPPLVNDEERGLYEKGLSIYLDQSQVDPGEMALTLYENYKEVAGLHPDYYLLNLLLSTAYANLDEFDDFFTVFYRSYPYYHDHYLSYKIKAILHIKLYEREATLLGKEEQRKKVFENISKAIERNPKDPSLYKIGFLFTLPDQQKMVLNSYLTKIMKENILLPRNDAAGFVQKAIELKQFDLAQKFVDKSREWYQYSRVIDEVQQSLNQQKAKNIHE